jgi:hypothetical protein
MTGPTQRSARRRPDNSARPSPVADISAADEPAPARTAAAGFRERGRLRRRLRYLRRARELGYRDLGGFMFDLHRFGREGEDLVATKLAALMAIDKELRALETALGERREVAVLREPGIGSCLRCGALHGSADSFCPHCGQPLGRRERRPAIPPGASSQPESAEGDAAPDEP